ncbi:uncharacterized protein LOC143560449 [Bidens hawaiensis]|uniref:uncharacterized protein LOC143560449 n=1 Tax=Bidens hawaiensis TaxID=980011 RepID=UPI0040494362
MESRQLREIIVRSDFREYNEEQLSRMESLHLYDFRDRSRSAGRQMNDLSKYLYEQAGNGFRFLKDNISRGAASMNKARRSAKIKKMDIAERNFKMYVRDEEPLSNMSKCISLRRRMKRPNYTVQKNGIIAQVEYKENGEYALMNSDGKVNLDTSVAAALESLTREVKKLKAKVDRCEFCRGGHGTLECPVMNQQVDFVAGQNRFPNNYNNNSQNWNTYKNLNHNNSNWRPSGAPPGFQNSYNQGKGQYFNNNNTDGTNIQNNVQDSKGGLGRLEEMMKLILDRDQVTQKKLAEHDLLFKNQQYSILDIQRTVGDIARRLEERPLGQFSGIPQTNPVAQLKAISTRSGRVFGPEVVIREIEKDGEDELLDEEIEIEAPSKSQSTTPIIEPRVEKNTEKKTVGVRPPTHIINPAYVPYPARLKNQQYTKDYGHFLNIFSQLNVNLPFIEVLQHMPKYAKFLKDLRKRKDKLEELSTVLLNGECSAVVLNKVPEKLPDPGIFTIPCLFGSNTTCQALADLGASINLMPYSLYEKLDLGELTPTRMPLSLADRSVKYPRGVVENFLVKVDNLVFPADFVVLDMEADERVPIILGRPFLRTTRAIIDVFEGKITLRAGDDSATYLAKSMRHPSGQDGLIDPCHPVYLIESSISGMDPSLDESVR